MALVTCPECHALNISDTAEQCPKCGYSIKEHFIREMRKNEYEERDARQCEKIREEEQKLQTELEQKLAEIDELPYPQKPTVVKTMYNAGFHTITMLLIGGLAITLLLSFVSKLKLFIFLLAVIIVIGIPFYLFLLISFIGDYKSEVKNYMDQTEDWDKYKEDRKNKIRSDYKEYARNMAFYGSRTTPMPDLNINAADTPKCPVCGSTKIKKISTVSRATSVAMVGLASSKIGKQMECEKCGYKF